MSNLSQPPRKEDIRFNDWMSLLHKFVTKFSLSFSSGESLVDYVDDAAAAAGGVPVGGVYRTGSVVKVRVA